MLWVLIGLMTILALSFVVLPIVKPNINKTYIAIAGAFLITPVLTIVIYKSLGENGAQTASSPMMGSPSGVMGGNSAMMGSQSKMMNMDLGHLADGLADKLKKEPNNPEGWTLLARTYFEIKRYKEAVPAFEKALQYNPNDPNMWAEYATARIAVSNGESDNKAKEALEKSLKLDPNNVKALMLRATLAYTQKDYKGAIADWEAVLKSSGIDAEVTKEAQGSIAEAKKMLGQEK
jgi:cytochrome c-type biogenesis protein CcmH